MSPVVGVPKREPCQKCGNPVFLAERVPVGRTLYHRTCLRCARCNSQLTLGSFYETETDGVFCCETCPDEEAKGKRNDQSSIASSSSDQDMVDDYSKMDPTRKSFSEKLAMFQTSDKSLLQKSLSDEEKSKSLQRLSEMYARNVSTNINDALGAPPTKSDAVPETATHLENEDDKYSDSSTDTESENIEPSPILGRHEKIEASQAPPPIPSKPPPIASKANVLNKIYGSAATPSPIKSTQRVHESDPQTLHNSATEFASKMLATNRQEEEEPSASQTQPSIASSSNLTESNNSEISPPHSTNDFHASDDSNAMPSNHHQQETIPNVTKDETTNCNESIEVSEAVDLVANVAEVETSFVSVAGASNESHLETNAEDESKVFEASDRRDVAATEQIDLRNSAIPEIERNATEQDDAITTTPSKPVPVKRAMIPAESNDAVLQPPTPMRRKNISNVVADDDASLSIGNESHSMETTPAPTVKIDSAEVEEPKQYPVDLNPFGDSENEEEELKGAATKPELRKSIKLDTSNPFDSSDDEIELLKGTPQKATEQKPKAVR